MSIVSHPLSALCLSILSEHRYRRPLCHYSLIMIILIIQSSHKVGLLSERVVLVHVITAMYDNSENTNFTAAEAYYVAVKLHYVAVESCMVFQKNNCLFNQWIMTINEASHQNLHMHAGNYFPGFGEGELDSQSVSRSACTACTYVATQN